jgi:hypothetical protein
LPPSQKGLGNRKAHIKQNILLQNVENKTNISWSLQDQGVIVYHLKQILDLVK